MDRYLEAASEDLRDMGLQAHAEILEGNAASVINYRAENDPSVELVVMPSHTRSGIMRRIAPHRDARRSYREDEAGFAAG